MGVCPVTKSNQLQRATRRRGKNNKPSLAKNSTKENPEEKKPSSQQASAWHLSLKLQSFHVRAEQKSDRHLTTTVASAAKLQDLLPSTSEAYGNSTACWCEAWLASSTGRGPKPSVYVFSCSSPRFNVTYSSCHMASICFASLSGKKDRATLLRTSIKENHLRDSQCLLNVDTSTYKCF